MYFCMLYGCIIMFTNFKFMLYHLFVNRYNILIKKIKIMTIDVLFTRGKQNLDEK